MADMSNLNRQISSVANGQLGVVSREQALAAGGSTAQLRRRVASGTLESIGQNTFRLPGAPATAIADLRALILDIGGAVWASGQTAAALHGFDGHSLKPPFDLTVRRGRNITRLGHNIHTTTELGLVDQAVLHEVPALSGARTLIDLARSQPVDQLVIAYDSGLRDGKFNESLLHRRIVSLATKGRYGIPKLLDAINTLEHGKGGHSWLEREFLRLITVAGLPRPDTQQVLTRAHDKVVRVDFRFANTNVVVEVLGYRYHRTTDQIARDTARMNALVADGFRVYQFTYCSIVEEPDDVLAAVREALAT